MVVLQLSMAHSIIGNPIRCVIHVRIRADDLWLADASEQPGVLRLSEGGTTIWGRSRQARFNNRDDQLAWVSTVFLALAQMTVTIP
jgi:hypothetical protein